MLEPLTHRSKAPAADMEATNVFKKGVPAGAKASASTFSTDC